jgi:hypothetical protein
MLITSYHKRRMSESNGNNLIVHDINLVLMHVGPLLGNDREMSKYIGGVTEKRLRRQTYSYGKD